MTIQENPGVEVVLELEPSTDEVSITMHTTWIRRLLICSLALPAAMAAMHIVRDQATPAAIVQEAKPVKPAANAVAKASQMDKIADALRGE